MLLLTPAIRVKPPTAPARDDGLVAGLGGGMSTLFYASGREAGPVYSQARFTPVSPWMKPLTGGVFTDDANLHRPWWAQAAISVAVEQPLDPLVTLHLPASWGWPAQTIEMHVPASAKPPGNSDNTVVFVDGRLVVDLWEAHKQADGSWIGAAGALTTTDSTGWSTAQGVGAGIRAVGASALGGLITAADVKGGVINHALAIAMPPDMLAPGYVAPAISSDAPSNASGHIKEGQRIGIPPGTLMPPLHTALGKMVFTALRTYGAYVVDQCQGSVPIIQVEAGVTMDSGFYWPTPSDVNAIGPMVRIVN